MCFYLWAHQRASPGTCPHPCVRVCPPRVHWAAWRLPSEYTGSVGVSSTCLSSAFSRRVLGSRGALPSPGCSRALWSLSPSNQAAEPVPVTGPLGRGDQEPGCREQLSCVRAKGCTTRLGSGHGYMPEGCRAGPSPTSVYSVLQPVNNI